MDNRPNAVAVSSYLAFMCLGVLDVAFLGFRWGFQGSWTAVLFLGLLPFAVAGVVVAAGNWLVFSLASKLRGQCKYAIPALFWALFAVLFIRKLLAVHPAIDSRMGAAFALVGIPAAFVCLYKFWKYMDGERSRPLDVLLGVMFLLLGGAAFWINATVYVGLYGYFHNILTVAALFPVWGVAELALRHRVRSGLKFHAVMLGITIVMALGAHFGASNNAARHFVLHRSTMAQRLYAIMHSRTDWDRDGFVTWFGGGDCAGFDGNVHPLAFEIPGDGVDNNCTGLDGYLPSNPWMKREPVAVDAENRRDVNVLWISIDALRSDRLGVHGYARDGRSITPNLDEFAKDSFNFHNAYVTWPGTLISMMSLTRGKISRPPLRRRFDPTMWDVVKRLDDEPTIWELIEPLGVTTAGRFVISMFATDNEIMRGAKLVDNEYARIHDHRQGASTAPELVKKSLDDLADLKRNAEPFWFWTHIFEPHAPYFVREGYDFGRSVHERYDSEVAFSDEWFGRFIQGLKQMDLYDDSIIVVFADHGEEIYDRGGLFHAKSLYDEEIRVPLMIRIPGVGAGEIATPVSLIDIVPTLIDHLNLPVDEEFSGRSLMPLLLDEPHELDYRVIYQLCVTGAVVKLSALRWPWKYIWNSRFSTVELYNLENDPVELVNRVDAEPEIAEELWTALFAWLEREELH